jgi:hypothetical protein
MKNKRKTAKYLLPLLLVGLFFLILAPALAQPNLGDDITSELGKVQSRTGLKSLDLPALVGDLIKAALTILGTVFMILILYGGFLWMTAGGNSTQTEKAGKVIRNASIGLIIIIVSYAVTITVFTIILRATSAVPFG